MAPHRQHRTFLACTAVLLATSTLAWGATVGYIGGNQTDTGGTQELLGEMMADDGKGSTSGSVVDDIIKDLNTGRSTVWLFTVHGKKKTFTLIVGPFGSTINLDESYGFEQNTNTLNSSSIKLMTPRKLKDRWPALTGSYLNMVALHDSKQDYILFVGKKDVIALNVATGNISQLLWNSDMRWRLNNSLLSSSEDLSVYASLSISSQFAKVHFPSMPPSEFSVQYGPFICNSDQKGIIFNRNPCNPPVSWIKTGFVDVKKVIIFTEDNSVVIFAKSAYEAATGEVVPIKKIAASQFWNNINGPPPTTPAQPTTWDQLKPAVITVAVIASLGIIGYLGYLAKKHYYPEKDELKRFADDPENKSQKTLYFNTALIANQPPAAASRSRSQSPSRPVPKQSSRGGAKRSRSQSKA